MVLHQVCDHCRLRTLKEVQNKANASVSFDSVFSKWQKLIAHVHTHISRSTTDLLRYHYEPVALRLTPQSHPVFTTIPGKMYGISNDFSSLIVNAGTTTGRPDAWVERIEDIDLSGNYYGVLPRGGTTLLRLLGGHLCLMLCRIM